MPGRSEGKEGRRELGLRKRWGINTHYPRGINTHYPHACTPTNHNHHASLPPSLPFLSLPTIKSNPCSSFNALTMSLLSSLVLPKSNKLASIPRYNPPSRPLSFPSFRRPPARAMCRSSACREGKALVPREVGGREEVEAEAEAEAAGEGWIARPQRERKRRRVGAAGGAGGGGMSIAWVCEL